eukprot:954938-Ditylum_brightwellii.AAC.1
MPGEYFLKKKTDTPSKTKVAHFFIPVLAVKNVMAVTEITTDIDLNEIEEEVSISHQCVDILFQSM